MTEEPGTRFPHVLAITESTTATAAPGRERFAAVVQ